MRRAYVLLSGGIDSTTCLYLAARDWEEVVGVSVFYGQRHSREIEAATASCHRLGIRHHVLDLRSIVPKTMLTDPTAEVPNISYSEIQGVSPTYVPFRNGLMLSAAASWIQGERAQWDLGIRMRLTEAQQEVSAGRKIAKSIKYFHQELVDEWGLYFGAHAEDAHNWAYPDCTPEWIGAMANAIYVGTYRQLRLVTPLEWLGKADIIRLGERVGVRWTDTWSCYKGGAVHCGVCPTCRARRQGFLEAGVPDPTTYAQADAA